MSYLQHNENFLGTGDVNEKGETLEVFLEAYDPKKYDCPCNTVDIAVFKAGKDGLKLLMIRRKNHPNIGFWALPGGFVDLRENLEDAAKRELEEETGVTGISPVQVRTWGDFDRDPRWRVITTLYCTVIEEQLRVKGGDDAADARWFDIKLEEAVSREGTDLVTLTLTDPESDLTLRSQAERETAGDRFLSEDVYRQLSTDNIAGDHGLLIMDALRFVESRRTGNSASGSAFSVCST